MTDRSEKDSPDKTSYRFLSPFLRLYWMFVGTVGNGFVLIAIAFRKAPQIMDFVLLGTVVTVSVARLVDITLCQGQSADFEPASLKDWLKHTLWLVSLAGAFYLLTRLIAANEVF